MVSSSEGGILSSIAPLSDGLSIFLVQSTIILALTSTIGMLGPILKQPRVIFDILGGIILGPSVLGKIPSFSATIFPLTSMPTLGVIANFGLTLYLFTVGLELDNQLLRSYMDKAVLISVCGIVLPFGLGVAIAPLIYQSLLQPNDVHPSFATFAVFIGTAMSITAFPVLAR